MSDSHVRSISKAISWRIVGTVDTFVITLVITGNVVIAGSIAGVESISKIILYYLHERVWSNVTLGRKGPAAQARTGVPAADRLVETDLGATPASGAVRQSSDGGCGPRPTDALVCNVSTIHLSKGAST